jgi:hypothetical protein
MAEQVDTSTIRERIAAWERLPDDKRPVAASVSTAELIALLHELPFPEEANRYHQTLGAKWMCDAIVLWCRTTLRLNRNAQAFANDVQSKWQDESFWRPKAG